MARVINPLISQDARGSVSGLQFSRNRSGNFGSRKSTSNRKQGTVVTAHRARLKRAHSAWNDLDVNLKAAWEEYAPPTQTGRNAFVGSCLTNFTIGQAAPDLSPLTSDDTPLPTDFTYHPVYFVFFFYFLNWVGHVTDNRHVIIYLAQDTAPANPHVRKLPFHSATLALTDGKSLTPTWFPRNAALRIRVWDWHRGKSDLEIRNFIEWDVEKEL